MLVRRSFLASTLAAAGVFALHGARAEGEPTVLVQADQTKVFTDAGESESLRRLVALHAEETGSPHAKALVANWPEAVKKFWKVAPLPAGPDAPVPLYQFAGLGTPAVPTMST